MLQSGSTSVLGRAYGVDDVHPLPVPAGSRGVVDLLQNPAARRRGGGGGGRKAAGLRQARTAYGGGREGAARVVVKGQVAGHPLPSLYRGEVGLGWPHTPI